MTTLYESAKRALRFADQLAEETQRFVAHINRMHELEQAVEEAATDEEEAAAKQALEVHRTESDAWRDISGALHYYEKNTNDLRKALAAFVQPPPTVFSSVAAGLVAQSRPAPPAPQAPPFILSPGQQHDVDELAGIAS